MSIRDELVKAFEEAIARRFPALPKRARNSIARSAKAELDAKPPDVRARLLAGDWWAGFDGYQCSRCGEGGHNKRTCEQYNYRGIFGRNA